MVVHMMDLKTFEKIIENLFDNLVRSENNTVS